MKPRDTFRQRLDVPLPGLSDTLPARERVHHVLPGKDRQGRTGTLGHVALARVHQAQGVTGVIVADDIGGQGRIFESADAPLLLAKNRVEFAGQPVFLVAATNFAAACAARHLADIEFATNAPESRTKSTDNGGLNGPPPGSAAPGMHGTQPGSMALDTGTPDASDPPDMRAPRAGDGAGAGAPHIIGEPDMRAPRAGDGHVIARAELQSGKGTPRLDDAPTKAGGQFRITLTAPPFGRDTAFAARIGAGGRLALCGPFEEPDRVRAFVAYVTGHPAEWVDVTLTRPVGDLAGAPRAAGAQCAGFAALSALTLGATCLFYPLDLFSGTEGNAAHRLGYRWRASANATGRLQALECTLEAAGGPVPEKTARAACKAALSALGGPCFWPGFEISAAMVCNTSAPFVPMHDAPVFFCNALATEVALDELARLRALDPLDMRLRNLYTAQKNLAPDGTRLDNMERLTRIVAQLCAQTDYWRQHAHCTQRNTPHALVRHGMALVPVIYAVHPVAAEPRQLGVAVRIDDKGLVRLHAGCINSGQDPLQRAREALAAELEIAREQIVVVPDFSGTLDHMAGGDSTAMLTALCVHATQQAARSLRARLDAFADAYYTLPAIVPPGTTISGQKNAPEKRQFDFLQLAGEARAHGIDLTCTGHATLATAAPHIQGTGSCGPAQPDCGHIVGAGCARLRIDILTGDIRIDHADILFHSQDRAADALHTAQVRAGFADGLAQLLGDNDRGFARHRPHEALQGDALSVSFAGPAGELPGQEKEAPSPGRVSHTEYGQAARLLSICVYSAIVDALAPSGIKAGHRYVPQLDVPVTQADIVVAAHDMLKNNISTPHARGGSV